MDKTLSRKYKKLWFYSKGLFIFLTIFFGMGILLLSAGMLIGFWKYCESTGTNLQAWVMYPLTSPVVGLLGLAPEIADNIVTKVVNGNRFHELFQSTQNALIDNLQACAKMDTSDTKKMVRVKNILRIRDNLSRLHWNVPQLDNTQISSAIMSVLSTSPEDYKHLLDECACNRKSTQGKKHDKILFKYRHAYQNLSLLPLDEYFKMKYRFDIESSIFTKILDEFDKCYDLAVADRASTLEAQFIREEIQYNKVRKNREHIQSPF